MCGERPCPEAGSQGFNPRFGGVGDWISEQVPRCPTAGVGFNPRFGGVGDWMRKGCLKIKDQVGVSIPDLVGLVIGCGPTDGRMILDVHCFNPRFGGVGDWIRNRPDRYRSSSGGFNPRFGGVGDWIWTRLAWHRQQKTRFNPRFGGVGDWILLCGRPDPSSFHVSIPDLVGLVIGYRSVAGGFPVRSRSFQSPIWWGW